MLGLTTLKGRSGAAILFVAIFLLFIVSPTPFRDFGAIRLSDLEAANPVTQVAFLSAFLICCAYVALTRATLVPGVARWICLATIAWAVVCATQSAEPSVSLRRLIMAVIVIVLAASAVLIPASLKQLTRLLIGIGLFTLALCYFGLAVFPDAAIHSYGDVLEPHLTGLWKGVFQHKNVTAPVMLMLVFVGLFAVQMGYAVAGWAMVIGSSVFLVGAGGKTAIALAPVILLISRWTLTARTAWRRTLSALGLLVVLNVITVGSVVLPPVAKLNEAIMPDPSFTGRTEIWDYGIENVRRRPLFGYGVGTFWRTSTVISPENPDFDDAIPAGTVPAWIKLVSHSHNAFLDAALSMGIPGLLLLIGWLVVTPMADCNRIVATGRTGPLALLLTRIWLLGIYLSSLEAIVFDRANPVWFLVLFGVFGLGMLARYPLRERSPASTEAPVAQGMALGTPGALVICHAVDTEPEPEFVPAGAFTVARI